ncbi:MAG: trypsin-like peptidase domain-containing protein [Planctomycetales bacterium]|nr:trypsin-like peptidase domain-containing protein [Planctomycetales bacterium]
MVRRTVRRGKAIVWVLLGGACLALMLVAGIGAAAYLVTQNAFTSGRSQTQPIASTTPLIVDPSPTPPVNEVDSRATSLPAADGPMDLQTELATRSPVEPTPAAIPITVPQSRTKEPTTGPRIIPVGELPALGDDVPVTLTATRPALVYQWPLNEKVMYTFQIESTLASNTTGYIGANQLVATDDAPAQQTESLLGESGSGTGFVVHPQGVLVTCAHVVRGSKKVVAKIGKTEYDATVIGLDNENDLAVLRIDATGLPHLTFADSDRVQLAQEVRVLGFPLSTVLGESIKITRGEVSGIGDTTNEKTLQIDATINPGNSGGPLLNGSGQVIGVASQLLAGEGISEVGMAIPSNAVTVLLESLKVPVELGLESGELTSTQIVSQAQPAVVYLKVEYGAGGVGVEQPKSLQFSGHLVQSSSNMYGYRDSSGTGSTRGKLIVDELGQVLSSDEGLDLPYMLGSVGMVGIEQLPADSSGRVSSSRPIALQQIERSSSPSSAISELMRRGAYRAPWMRGSLPDTTERTKVTLLVGVEKVAYQLGNLDGDLVELKKTYQLRIDGKKKSDPPYLTVDGTGIGKFNKARGVMDSMVFKSTVVLENEGIAIKVPVALKYERLDPELVAKREAEAKAQTERILAESKARTAATPPASIPTTPSRTSTSPPSTVIGGGQSKAGVTPGGFGMQDIKSVPLSTGLNQFDPEK